MAEQIKDEKAKKKMVKSKLSRPNPKQKQQPYSIEISSNAVKVIRVDAKGKIISSGFVPLEGDAIWSDKSWINRLSQSVKDAARDAKVPKGSNFACSVVAGDPQVIMQRFTWPELTHQAMLENSKHEISSYLPGVVSNFVISAEVQKRNEAEDNKIATMDVFVAAMPKDMATAISTAVTWAGFRVVSFDICENVRARLVNRCSRIESGIPSSYGILDLSSAQPNITLYLDGFFYSTHYFSGIGQGQQVGATIDEIESLMGSLDSIKGSSNIDNIVEHDVDALLGEISFVVDFIRYQERGSNLECILVMGRTQPGFSERLSAGLDMPVYSNDTWIRPGIFENVKGDFGFYLDVYASGLPSTVIGAKHMLDVKTDVMLKNPGRRLFAIASGITLVLFALLAVGIFIPFVRERGLQGNFNALQSEVNSVNALIARTPDDNDIQSLRIRVEFIDTRVGGINDFFYEFAQASVMVPLIFQTRFGDIIGADGGEGRELVPGFSNIVEIEANEDRISIEAVANDFNHLANILEYFADHELVWDANLTQDDVEEMTTHPDFRDYGTTTFVITIYQDNHEREDELDD